MQHTEDQVRSKGVYLRGFRDYKPWIETIKSSALEYDLWDHINPEQSEVQPLSRPSKPELNDFHFVENSEARIQALNAAIHHIQSTAVDGGAAVHLPLMSDIPAVRLRNTVLSDLTSDERELFRLYMQDFDYMRKQYDVKYVALGKLRTRIQESIHRDLLPYTYDAPTVHQILVNLRNEVAPRPQANETVLAIDWRELWTKHLPKKVEDVETWIRRCDTTFDRLTEINMPHVYGRRPFSEFNEAVEKLSPDWSRTQSINLLDPRFQTITFKEFTSLYRNYVLEQGLSRRATSHHGAFATNTPTFQGADKSGAKDYGISRSSGAGAGAGGKKRAPDCFCGSKHWYSDCYYVNPSKAPSKWKSKQDIQAIFDKKMASDTLFKTQIEMARRPYTSKAVELSSKAPDFPTGAMAAITALRPQMKVSLASRTFYGPPRVGSRNVQDLLHGDQIPCFGPENAHINTKDETQLTSSDHFSQNKNSDQHQQIMRNLGEPGPPAIESNYAGITESVFAVGDNHSVEPKYDLFSSYILDSGATIHICNDQSRFTDFRPPASTDLIYAGDQLLPVQGWGTAFVNLSTGIKFQLKDCAYIPTFHCSVVSLKRLHYAGIEWSTKLASLMFKDVLMSETPMIFDQWVVEYNDRPKQFPAIFAAHVFNRSSSPTGGAFPARKSTEPKVSSYTMGEWHIRLGHLNQQALSHLEDCAKGVKVTTHKLNGACCEACRVASSRKIISRRPRTRGHHPFYRVAWDLIEMRDGLGGNVYVLHFVEDMLSLHYVYVLQDKSEDTLMATIRSIEAYVWRQYQLRIRVWKHDGEQSIGGQYDRYIADGGYQVEESTPQTQEQNGVSERSGQMLILRATLLRFIADLPRWLWPELFKTAGYLLNRSPTRSLNWKSPLQCLQEWLDYPDSKPSLAHLQPIGCKVFSLIKNRMRLDKLEPRAHIGYLIGYDSTNIFRVYLPFNNTVISTRDVTFDPSQLFKDSKEEPDLEPELLESLTITIPRLNDEVMEALYRTDDPSSNLEDWERETEAPGDTIVVQTHQNQAPPLLNKDSDARDFGESSLDHTSASYNPQLVSPRLTPEPDPEDPQLSTNQQMIVYQLSTIPEEQIQDSDLTSQDQNAESQSATKIERVLMQDLLPAGPPSQSTSRQSRPAQSLASRPTTLRLPTTNQQLVRARGAKRQQLEQGRIDSEAVIDRTVAVIDPLMPSSSNQLTTTRVGATYTRSMAQATGPRRITRSSGLLTEDQQLIPARKRKEAGMLTFAVHHAVAMTDLHQLSAFYATFHAAMNISPQGVHQSTLPPPPKNWKQMLVHPHMEGFRSAAQSEWSALEAQGSWEPVMLADAQRQFVIPVMWVFTYKVTEDGFLKKYKARLVIRGDLVRPDGDDTYAATLASRLFRMLMAVVAYFNLECKQFDVSNAFTYAHITRLTYVMFAEGYERPGMVLHLLRALYGLPRSPRLWFDHLTSVFVKLGLRQTSETPCVFTSDKLIVFFFVDDICVIYHPSNRQAYEAFRTGLLTEYNLHELGDIKWFLGIRIIRDRHQRKLWLSQDTFAEAAAHKFKRRTTNRKSPKIPMPTDGLSPWTGQASAADIGLYQSKCGTITYAACMTRADLAYASQELSRHHNNPSPEHMAAADQALDYFDDHRFYALEMGGDIDDGIPALSSASDASYADDRITRKSSMGWLFILFNGLIDWSATLQKTVTTSTTEAELLALSHITAWLLWWIRFFHEIDLDLDQDFVVLCDNLQTVRLINTEAPKLITKLKHIDVHHHWLRQEASAGKFKVEWVKSADMPADGLTKALPAQQFQAFLRQINMVDIQALIAQ